MIANKFFTAILVLFCFGLASLSNSHAEIVEGRDYTVLTNPQPTLKDDSIEVIEFFWYGCPHCNHLHPHIKAWLGTIPDDVYFSFIPGILRSNWVSGAKIFYAMATIGATEILHDRVYEAIHRDKINLANESVLFDWVEKQGVEREKFENAYKSFAVQNHVAKSTQMTRQYQLTGVPALVIDGRYMTSGKRGGTPQETIMILEKIIDKVRKEKNQ